MGMWETLDSTGLVSGIEYEDQPGLQELNLLDHPHWLALRIAGFKKVCEQGEAIFWERGKQYGDATAETGLLGAAITLTTDVARIRNILLNVDNLRKLEEGDPELTEKLRDAIIDAHNYSAICFHWLSEGNLMGRAVYE